jgi:hypothetical protein
LKFGKFGRRTVSSSGNVEQRVVLHSVGTRAKDWACPEQKRPLYRGASTLSQTETEMTLCHSVCHVVASDAKTVTPPSPPPTETSRAPDLTSLYYVFGTNHAKICPTLIICILSDGTRI